MAFMKFNMQKYFNIECVFLALDCTKIGNTVRAK